MGWPRPSLASAERRKWWLLITAAIENLLFGQLLFGWASLLLMLKAEEFYAHMCPDGHGTNHTALATNHTSVHHPHDHNAHAHAHAHNPQASLSAVDLHSTFSSSGDADMDPYMAVNQSSMRRLLSGGFSDPSACSPQDRILNIAYTICLFAQTGSGFVIGALQDKYGYKTIRLVGSFLFMLSSFVFIFADSSTYWLLIPLLVMGAIGGTSLVFTSFQISNLFGNLRGTMLGILVGAMSSCAVMFSIFKALYDQGMGIEVMWVFMAIGGLWSFLNCLFTWPAEVIPVPDDLRSKLALYKLAGDKKSDKQYLDNLQLVGNRMSTSKTSEWHSLWTSNLDLTQNNSDDDDGNSSFMGILCSALFFLGLLFMSVVFLRLLLYIGTMYLALLKLTDIATMSRYVEIFGYMQLLCFPTCPALNWLLDRGTKPQDLPEGDERERNFTLRIRKLKNCRLVFFINSCLIVVFGVCAMIPNLHLQFLTFATHTILRGTGMSAILGMFAVCFPFQYMGKLVGLLILMSAVIDLVQSPLFLIIDGPLHGDPFWIDVVLFGASLLAFTLPLYLFFYVRRLTADFERKRCKPGTRNGVYKLAKDGDPFARKLARALDEKELFT